MTFAESPNKFVTSGSYDIELNFTVVGQTQTQTISVDEFESEGTWSRSDNTLIFDGSLFSMPLSGGAGMDEIGSGDMIIEKLDETTLRLTMSETEEFTQGGTPVSATVTSSIEFTREQ
jgi:hypothetical protein